MNQEMYNKCESPDTVTVITVGILEWLGYAVSMVMGQQRGYWKANGVERET
jgi:hypothetical protein